MTIRILRSAKKDLDEGWEFYEEQEPGLGAYFVACLRSDIEGLRVTGGVHAKKYGDYHRMLSRVFPYAVFYTLKTDEVIVYAVIDCRNDPERIRRRLKP